MMKKMLVLALVLAVAGLANAALSFDNGKISYSTAEALVGGINVYFGSVQVAPDEFTGFEGRMGAGAPVSAPAFTAYNGQDAIDNQLPWVLGFTQISWGDAVIAPNPAGFWFSVMVPAGKYVLGTDQAFDVQVDVMDATTGAVESLFLAVPEPMTMVLLGLGGLFLRKKK